MDILFILNHNRMMKKQFIFFAFLLCYNMILSQQKSDTIEINQFKTTQIIFNEDITFVEAGTGDLQVKNKIVDNILILQSVVTQADFIITNLFIKTKSGIYNPIIRYNENPKRSTMLESDLKTAVVSTTKNTPVRVVTPQPESKPSVKNDKEQNRNSKREREDLGNSNDLTDIDGGTSSDRAIVDALVKKHDLFKPSRQYTTDVWFRFYAHYIKDGKFYFKFQIENDSDLAYQIENFFFSVQSIKSRKTSDTQREINYTKFLNPTEVIPARSKKFLIFEFNSFSINKNEEFIVEVKEKNGARNFKVGVPYFIVNKPITF